MKKSIDINNLTFKYPGTDFNAIDHLTLTVEEGDIFGLLGPNGAGKTTLISILTGLLPNDSGQIFFGGLNLHQEQRKIKALIGVVPQEYALYPKLTAKENLRFFGSMYGLTNPDLNQRIDRGIAEMSLTPFANKKINTFSGGMKRRINLLAGVLHRPKIIFLDEPTVGVDVFSKQQILSYLSHLNSKGITIIYTSHMLHEAQDFCTKVAIMDGGRIKLQGKTQTVLLKNGKLKTLEEIFVEITHNPQLQ